MLATSTRRSRRQPSCNRVACLYRCGFGVPIFVTTQTPGQSALQFQRQLGLKRYETAFQMLHKLRAGLVRPERDTVGDQYPVEVDKSFVGGRTKGEGRGVHHKAIVIGAIEVRPRKAPVKGARRTFYAGRLRLRLTCQIVRPKAYRSLCGRMWRKEPSCTPTAGRAMMIWRHWVTCINLW